MDREQLTAKIRQLVSDVLDWWNPRRVQYRDFCRWMDGADRASTSEEFYELWRHAEHTRWKGDPSDEDRTQDS